MSVPPKSPEHTLNPDPDPDPDPEPLLSGVVIVGLDVVCVVEVVVVVCCVVEVVVVGALVVVFGVVIIGLDVVFTVGVVYGLKKVFVLTLSTRLATSAICVFVTGAHLQPKQLAP